MPDPSDLPLYRYRYTGVQRLTFPSLTGYGVGELAPPDEGEEPTVIEIPVLLEHPDLEPADDATIAALAATEAEEQDPAEVMPPASLSIDDVPDGTKDELLAWVHEDPDHVAERAALALGKENAADEPRVTVVEALTRIANTEEH